MGNLALRNKCVFFSPEHGRSIGTGGALRLQAVLQGQTVDWVRTPHVSLSPPSGPRDAIKVSFILIEALYCEVYFLVEN